MIRGMESHFRYAWLHDRPCSIQPFYLGGWDEGVLPLSQDEITHLGRRAKLVYSSAQHNLTVRPERILTEEGRNAWRKRLDDLQTRNLRMLHAAVGARAALPGEVGYSPLNKTYYRVEQVREWGEIGLEKYWPTALEALAAQDKALAREIRLYVRSQQLVKLRSRLHKCARAGL